MQSDHETLTDVFIETLEQFALLFGEPADSGEMPPTEEPYRSAVIRFQAGSRTGEFIVAASPELCREVAANIIGLDPEDVADEAMTDSVKELANVVLGAMADRCFGAQTVCEMEPPEVRSLDRDALAAMIADPDGICMRVDDHFLLARLNVQ